MRKKTFRERVKFYLRMAGIPAASARFSALSVYYTVFPVAGDYHLSVFDGYTAAAQSFVAKYV